MWIFGPLQKEWQVLCTNLYLGHPCGAIVDLVSGLFSLDSSFISLHTSLSAVRQML